MITLITPTRNRPIPFGLAEQWIARQTYKGDLQWIVVNDGTVKYEYTMDQTVIHRSAGIHEGQGSLAYNLLAALPYVHGDKVVIFEDDDWVHPRYLDMVDTVMDPVKGPHLIGLTPSRHYNLKHRKYRINRTQHCNLGSTSMTRAVLPFLRKVLLAKADAGVFTIDMTLWKWQGRTQKLDNEPVYHVGLKGLPGEPGLGVGHKDIGIPDKDLDVLRQWIGEDVKHYEDLVAKYGQ